jgi:hypothetical protein
MADETTTIRMVVFDLLGDLKQVYSEASLSPYKIFYWTMVHADRLRKLHVQKIDVVVSVDSATGRNYFELPAAIYDFDGDDGIDYLTYPPGMNLSLPMFSSITFTRTTPGKAGRLYFRSEEKPSPSNVYFYRQNKYIYLLGVEEINLTKIEAGLKTSLAPASLTVDIDQPFDFPQDLIPQLKRQILDMGRFVMQIPADRVNDGAAFDAKEMPTQKIVSVNDGMDQQNQQNQQQQY